LDIDPYNDQAGAIGDVGITFTQAEHVLKRWHEDIEQAVSEGEQYENYANIYLPNAKMEAEKIALTLVHFKKVDHDNLPKHSVEQKEKKEKKLPGTLSYPHKYLGPLKLSLTFLTTWKTWTVTVTMI